MKYQIVNIINIKIFLLCFLTILIFYFDTLTPLGINEAYFYLIPVLFTIQIPGKSSTSILSIIAIILTLLGIFFSHKGVLIEISISNRLYAILGICVTCYILMKNKEKEKIMKQQNEALVKSVLDLNNANFDLEQYAYIASHDLQEPLRNITNYIRLLEKRVEIRNDEAITFFLDGIIKSAGKMKTLIQNILLYSLISKDSPREKVDCGTVINDVLADLEYSTVENEVKITVENLPVIDGNKTYLKQIFQNLISNAIKFKTINTVPEILIYCENKNTEWEFSVRDNGIGIEEEYFEQIFKVFQRLHSEDNYPGTGIGLATCKKNN